MSVIEASCVRAFVKGSSFSNVLCLFLPSLLSLFLQNIARFGCVFKKSIPSGLFLGSIVSRGLIGKHSGLVYVPLLFFYLRVAFFIPTSSIFQDAFN